MRDVQDNGALATELRYLDIHNLYNPRSGATARDCASSNKYPLLEVISITLDVMNTNRLSQCEEHTAPQGPLWMTQTRT